MRFLSACLTLLTPFSLFAHPLTSLDIDPSVLFESVDVTTGSYLENCQDLVVKGAVPLSIHRGHISQDLGEHPGIWRFHDERILTTFSHNYRQFRFSSIALKEASGGVVLFDETVKLHKEKIPDWCNREPERWWEASPYIRKDYCNTASGQVGGKTHPKNYRLFFNYKTYTFILETGNGEKRLYKLVGETPYDGVESAYRVQFALHQIIRPNGTVIKYTYDLSNRLSKIEGYGGISPSPEGPTNFCDPLLRLYSICNYTKDSTPITWVQFHYLDDEGDEVTKITASDGQRIDYQYETRKGVATKPRRQLLLSKATLNETDTTSYDHSQHRIVSKREPSGNSIQIDYLHDGKNAIEHQNKKAFQVAGQKAPVGPIGAYQAISTFYYHFSEGSKDSWTDAYDGNLNRNRYHFTSHGKVYLKELFSPIDQKEKRIRFEGFDWEESLIKRKFICDDLGISSHLTTFEYDSRGNIIKEIESGALTGAPFVYTIRPVYSGEHQHKRHAHRFCYEPKITSVGDEERYEKSYLYSNDPFNNLFRESYDKVDIIYGYCEGTDLVSTKKTYVDKTLKLREDFEYNRNGFLSFYKRSDGFRTRIKRIHFRQESPGLGMPEVIEELALDGGKEILLLKERICYSNRYEVIQRAIYDAESSLRYTLYFDYDPMGRVTRSIDAEGQETVYRYDQGGRLAEKVTPTSHVEWIYDSAGRPIKTITRDFHGSIKSEAAEYDFMGYLKSQTDPYGNITRFKVDGDGHPTRIDHPVNETNGRWVIPTAQQTFDACGNLTAKTDENGATIRYTYNGRNQVTSIIYPDDSEEHFSYFLNGQLKSHLDRSGLRTTYTRDFLGRPLSITWTNSAGEILKETRHTYEGDCLIATLHPDGTTTHFTYNSLGQLIEEDHEGRQVTFTYDLLSRKATETRCTAKGFATTHYSHDLLNRVVREEVTDESGQLLTWKAYQYDFEGRKILESEGGSETRTTYGLYGPLAVTDPNGATTNISHDSITLNGKRVRQTLQVDPLGQQTFTTYNPRGQIHTLEKRDTRGNLLSKLDKRYDLANHPITERYTAISEGQPLREYTIRHTYNVVGQPLSITEEQGQKRRTTSYTYDKAGRLSTTTKPSGDLLIQTYDIFGRLSTHTGPDFSDTYEYDLGDRLLSITFQNGEVVSRSYDLRGYLISETFPNHHHITYARDLQGRAEKVTLPDASTFEYTFSGPLLTQAVRKGYAFSYHYNTAGKVVTVEGPREKTDITYDLAYRPILIESPSFREELSYDVANNLIEEKVTDPHGSLDKAFSHNGLYQLIHETGPTPHEYTYDSLDTRLSADRDPYSYDELNQLTSTGDLALSYDEDGQTLSCGEWSFIYDSRGRLISAKKGEVEIVYTYDPLHRRLSKRVYEKGKALDHACKDFLYLEQEEVGAIDGRGYLTECRLPGPPLTSPNPSSPLLEFGGYLYFPIHDYRGSIVVLLNTWGYPSETYRYDAFGNGEVIGYWGGSGTLSSSDNPYQFLSKRYEKECEWVFFGRRYYLPSLGRWLTPDPRGFDDGPNLYAYCHGSPLTLIDLRGLASQKLHLSPFQEKVASFLQADAALRPDRISPYQVSGGNFERAISHCPDIWNDVKTFNLGRKTLPNGTSIHLTPGINTRENRAWEMMESYSDICGGYNVICTFQSTLGLPFDVARVHLGMNHGLAPPVVDQFVKDVRNDWNQSKKFGGMMLSGHSGGTTTVRNGLMLMEKEERERCFPLLIACSAYVSRDLCPNARHLASKHDFVPLLDTKGRAKCVDSTTWLTPHPDAKFWDHDGDSPTYVPSARDYFRKYFDKLIASDPTK